MSNWEYSPAIKALLSNPKHNREETTDSGTLLK